jgi:hypothetical protein
MTSSRWNFPPIVLNLPAIYSQGGKVMPERVFPWNIYATERRLKGNEDLNLLRQQKHLQGLYILAPLHE